MKLGMVFEGGASRTVFSCGVADAFLEENIMPDYFIGVSAGIAFGISYLAGQKGRNLTLAKQYMSDGNYQGFQFLFDRNNKSFYNIDYVFDTVPNELLPFDWEAFARFPGKIEAVVTNIHTGKAEYKEVPRTGPRMDEVVASCALPVFFQPVKLGNRYYLDGGVSDSVPYLHALEEGCDKVVVVLTRERDYVKHKEAGVGATAALYHKYPRLVKTLRHRPEAYNTSMKRLKELEREGRVFVIAPDSTLGVGRTESRPDKLEALYEAGYLKAKEQMTALRNYLKEA